MRPEPVRLTHLLRSLALLIAITLVPRPTVSFADPPNGSPESKEGGWTINRGEVKIDWLDIDVKSKTGLDPKPITAIGRGPDDVSFADLAILRRLHALQVITDFTTSFDDKSLAALSPKAPLRALVIPGSKVTDAGIAKLAEFPGLEYLDIPFCKITDKSIDTLSRLKYLRLLNVHRTMISEDGRKRLEKLLPNCEFLDFDWHF